MNGNLSNWRRKDTLKPEKQTDAEETGDGASKTPSNPFFFIGKWILLKSKRDSQFTLQQN